MKITILTDKTSWMKKYDLELKDKLINIGHEVEIIYSKKDLTKSDVAFFLSCLELIPQSQLSLNKHNIVVHPSDLPKGKGWSPSSWQILEGKSEIPLTLFEAVEEVDAGDFYIKDTVKLDGFELVDLWRQKIANKIVEMCLKFIEILSEDKLKPMKQKGGSTFYPKRIPQDNELDVNKTIVSQFNLLRIVDNERYPSFFILDGRKYILRIERTDK
jgi:methionyl-tRNA formyltransferase